MKRILMIVGVCLLAFIIIASIAATKQGLTLRAIPKLGSGTIVEFSLPKASRVNLSIYDVMGRKVANLLENQYLGAGKHAYLWDARNGQGKHVSDGIYFVNLRVGSEYRCIKLAYIAGSIMFSSPREDATEMTEEDIIKAKITPEQYEQAARKLAKSMAAALPKIQLALWKAMELSTDKREHKVELVSLINTIGSTICATGHISEIELENMMSTYSNLLYIEPLWRDKRWSELVTEAKGKIEVIAVRPPYDEKEWQTVYAYDKEAKELKLSPDGPPDFPIFLITHEPPYEDFSEIYEVPRGTKQVIERKAVAICTDTTYLYKIAIYRKCDWDFMEIYIKYYTDFGGPTALKKRTGLTKVDKRCKWYSWAYPGKNVSDVVEIFRNERHTKIEVWEKDNFLKEFYDEDDLVGRYTFTGNDRIAPHEGTYNILDGDSSGSYCDTTWVGTDILDAVVYLVTGIEYCSY